MAAHRSERRDLASEIEGLYEVIDAYPVDEQQTIKGNAARKISSLRLRETGLAIPQSSGPTGTASREQTKVLRLCAGQLGNIYSVFH